MLLLPPPPTPGSRIESTLVAFEAAGDRIPFTGLINVQRYFRESREVVRIEPMRERERARWTIFVESDSGQTSGFRVDVLGRVGRPIRAKGRVSQVQALHLGCRAVAPYGFAGPFVFNGVFHRDQWLMLFQPISGPIGSDRIVTVDAATGAVTLGRGH